MRLSRIGGIGSSNENDFDYQLVEQLAWGGLSDVFLARELGLDRKVVIKTIRKDLQHSDTNKRFFLWKLRLLSSLHHPYVPPIYDYGITQEGVPFYSTAYIEYISWQSVLKKQSLAKNLEILLKAVDVVSYLRSQGLLHLDLTPNRLIVGSHGTLFLTHWQMTVDLDNLTNAAFGGTPNYMPPEIASRQVEKIGTASAVYQIGAILYQLVTGHPPHPGRTAIDCLTAAIKNIIVETPINDPFLDIAYKAMAMDPKDRYESIEKMQEIMVETLRSYLRT